MPCFPLLWNNEVMFVYSVSMVQKIVLWCLSWLVSLTTVEKIAFIRAKKIQPSSILLSTKTISFQREWAFFVACAALYTYLCMSQLWLCWFCCCFVLSAERNKTDCCTLNKMWSLYWLRACRTSPTTVHCITIKRKLSPRGRKWWTEEMRHTDRRAGRKETEQA